MKKLTAHLPKDFGMTSADRAKLDAEIDKHLAEEPPPPPPPPEPAKAPTFFEKVQTESKMKAASCRKHCLMMIFFKLYRA